MKKLPEHSPMVVGKFTCKVRLVVCVIILGNIFSILWFSRFFKKILIIYTEYIGEGDQFRSTTDYLK